MLLFFPRINPTESLFFTWFWWIYCRNWLAFLHQRHLVTITAVKESRNQLDKNAFETGSVVLFAAQIILEDALLSCVTVMPLKSFTWLRNVLANHQWTWHFGFRFHLWVLMSQNPSLIKYRKKARQATSEYDRELHTPWGKLSATFCVTVFKNKS